MGNTRSLHLITKKAMLEMILECRNMSQITPKELALEQLSQCTLTLREKGKHLLMLTFGTPKGVSTNMW